MSSLLKIANTALTVIGVREIDSLLQQGPVAARCNSHVVDVVKAVIREHAWSFATLWTTPPMLATPPPFGFDYAYQLPNNTVKLIDARQDPKLDSPFIDYQLARNNTLYTDADPCYVRLTVYNEADLVRAPSDFIKACGYLLAAEIATPLTKSDKAPAAMNMYSYFLDRAKLSDVTSVREVKKDENQTCLFLKVRDFPTRDDEGGFW